MTAEDALAHVRPACGGTAGAGVLLAARLLDAVELARDLLAPLADEEFAPGARVAEVFQLLADAAADAAPPSPAPAGAPGVPVSRNGGAALLACALALKP